MISFEIAGGRPAVQGFVEHLAHFSLAESLGGVESLVCHPPSMTHAPLDEAALAAAGIGQNLIRLSIGLESASDLEADLRSALSAAMPRSRPGTVAVA
jgi:cystathionine gamma-synthase